VHLTVESTIDTCRHLADQGAEEGTVVLAEEQRRGRGQSGRGWYSPRGKALYLSALLRPPLDPKRAPDLVGLAGLAASEALHDACAVQVRLKRPNDLLIEEPGAGLRKVGGLLIDTAVQGEQLKHAIVSLGLNVNQRGGEFPESIRPWATSLRLVTGRGWSREHLACSFLRRLEELRREFDSEQAAEKIEARLARWAEQSADHDDFQAPAWENEETP
jgi:BirA family biotin operon repressor/biotin-[acetyl-CoA-carboxylase] ligase